MNCLHCGAPTTNGLALCETCRAAASVYLEFLPVYFRNLSRWRPGRAGSRPVPGSREPTGFGAAVPDRVSRAVDEAGADLVGWARSLADDRPGRLSATIARILTFDEERTFRLLCALFDKHLNSVSTLGWAGEFVRRCSEHEVTLRSFTESVAPGWYAGACKRCDSATYVVPGLTWVTCGACGSTTYARDHLDTILAESRGWVAAPMRMAETIVALVDTEQSVPRLHKRIVKWGDRGRVSVLRRRDADGDEVGPRRYRFGEVLDALQLEGATRLTRSRAKAVS